MGDGRPSACACNRNRTLINAGCSAVLELLFGSLNLLLCSCAPSSPLPMACLPSPLTTYGTTWATPAPPPHLTERPQGSMPVLDVLFDPSWTRPPTLTPHTSGFCVGVTGCTFFMLCSFTNEHKDDCMVIELHSVTQQRPPKPCDQSCQHTSTTPHMHKQPQPWL